MDEFMVGYGRADITPTEPVPLMGYGNTTRRISANVLDPLYATCVAMGALAAWQDRRPAKLYYGKTAPRV